jgi:hypothetical protein
MCSKLSSPAIEISCDTLVEAETGADDTSGWMSDEGRAAETIVPK